MPASRQQHGSLLCRASGSMIGFQSESGEGKGQGRGRISHESKKQRRQTSAVPASARAAKSSAVTIRCLRSQMRIYRSAMFGAGPPSSVAQRRSRITNSARPTNRVSTDKCVTRISALPSRKAVSRVTSTRFTNIEGFLTKYPDWRTAAPVSPSSHNAPLMRPSRFLRGVMRKT